MPSEGPRKAQDDKEKLNLDSPEGFSKSSNFSARSSASSQTKIANSIPEQCPGFAVDVQGIILPMVEQDGSSCNMIGQKSSDSGEALQLL